MIPPEVVWVTLAVFPISEIVLARRKMATAQDSSLQDQGTLTVLWVVIAMSIMGAIVVKALTPFVASIPQGTAAYLSILLTIVIGLDEKT